MNFFKRLLEARVRDVNEMRTWVPKLITSDMTLPVYRDPDIMIFSPHPDDECIVGGIVRRLQRQYNMRVMNVAITLGSKKERQQDRFAELTNACTYLQWGLISAGLEKINEATRMNNPNLWKSSVRVVLDILLEHKPRIILFPHDNDENSTHVGTHWLLMDALAAAPEHFSCTYIQTEYWAPMRAPNLMVEVSLSDLDDLMTALTYHQGEVVRNPYHLRLADWMSDNVRRGGELICGQGGLVPNFNFAVMYRMDRWEHCRSVGGSREGVVISLEDELLNRVC